MTDKMEKETATKTKNEQPTEQLRGQDDERFVTPQEIEREVKLVERELARCRKKIEKLRKLSNCVENLIESEA